MSRVTLFLYFEADPEDSKCVYFSFEDFHMASLPKAIPLVRPSGGPSADLSVKCTVDSICMKPVLLVGIIVWLKPLSVERYCAIAPSVT